jgi:hypothetical protein
MGSGGGSLPENDGRSNDNSATTTRRLTGDGAAFPLEKPKGANRAALLSWCSLRLWRLVAGGGFEPPTLGYEGILGV